MHCVSSMRYRRAFGTCHGCFCKLPSNTPWPPRHPQDITRETVSQDLETESRTPREPDETQVESRRSLDETSLSALLCLLFRRLLRLARHSRWCREDGVGRGRGLGEDEEMGDSQGSRHGDEITKAVGFAFLCRWDRVSASCAHLCPVSPAVQPSPILVLQLPLLQLSLFFLLCPAAALIATHPDPTTRVGLQHSPNILGQGSDSPSNHSGFDDEGFRNLGRSRVSRCIDKLDLVRCTSD